MSNPEDTLSPTAEACGIRQVSQDELGHELQRDFLSHLYCHIVWERAKKQSLFSSYFALATGSTLLTSIATLGFTENEPYAAATRVSLGILIALCAFFLTKAWCERKAMIAHTGLTDYYHERTAELLRHATENQLKEVYEFIDWLVAVEEVRSWGTAITLHMLSNTVWAREKAKELWPTYLEMCRQAGFLKQEGMVTSPTDASSPAPA